MRSLSLAAALLVALLHLSASFAPPVRKLAKTPLPLTGQAPIPRRSLVSPPLFAAINRENDALAGILKVLPLMSFFLSFLGVCFQVFVLYPWHEEVIIPTLSDFLPLNLFYEI